MELHVDPDRCPQNHACQLVAICPAQAISQQGQALPVIDGGLCFECEICSMACPLGAVAVTE